MRLMSGCTLTAHTMISTHNFEGVISGSQPVFREGRKYIISLSNCKGTQRSPTFHCSKKDASAASLSAPANEHRSRSAPSCEEESKNFSSVQLRNGATETSVQTCASAWRKPCPRKGTALFCTCGVDEDEPSITHKTRSRFRHPKGSPCSGKLLE